MLIPLVYWWYIVFHAGRQVKPTGVPSGGLAVGLVCESDSEDGTDGFPWAVQERHWEGFPEL